MPLRRRLLLVTLASFVLALPVVPLLRNDAARCGTVGECLGNSVALLGYLLIVPLLGWALLRLLKVAAPLVHALLAWAIGLALYAVGGAVATAMNPPTPFGERPQAAEAWILLFGAAAGALAVLLVEPLRRSGPRPGRRTVLAYAAIALALLAALVGSRALATGALQRAHRDAVARTGLTAYLPDIPGAQPGRAIADGERIRIWYDAANSPTKTTVVLLRTPPELCSSLTMAGTVSRASCRETTTADGARLMRAPFAEYETVAVSRGDTTLLVEGIDRRSTDADRVIAALTSAPRVGLTDLADRYQAQY